MSQKDGQTDRQLIMAMNTALRYASRGKKQTLIHLMEQ